MSKVPLESAKNSWYVWLFPVFAIVICLWLAYNHFSKIGPEITILFDEGSALQPEKTRIRFRGVNIGVVKSVEISDDGRKVIATAFLNKDAKHFAVEGSRFWLVSPKVSFQGITGLETLLDGSYIAVQGGSPDGKIKDSFNGEIGGQSNDPLEGTSSYRLETKNVESVNAGDSVTYRGLKIGEVTRVTLSKSSQSVLVQINIENKYVKVIRTNTSFWRKVAVQANLGLFNSSVKINSLDSILRGGIEIATPDNPGALAKANENFVLSENSPKDFEKWNPVLE